MLIPLLAVALAAPPEGLDVTDPTPFEASWSRIQEGPRGCWEVVGTTSWNWEAGRFGFSRGDSAFVGRFEDGVWRDVIVRSLGEREKGRQGPVHHVYDHDAIKVMPLVGKRDRVDLDQDADGVGDHVLTYALDRLGREVEYSDVRWDEGQGAVVLSRTIPFEQGQQQAKMEVVYPGGGALPAAMTITFPDTFSVPSFKLAKVHDAQARIRARVVGDEVFPEAEALTFEVSVLGVRGKGAQTLRYASFRRCGGVSEDEAAPVGR